VAFFLSSRYVSMFEEMPKGSGVAETKEQQLGTTFTGSLILVAIGTLLLASWTRTFANGSGWNATGFGLFVILFLDAVGKLRTRPYARGLWWFLAGYAVLVTAFLYGALTAIEIKQLARVLSGHWYGELFEGAAFAPPVVLDLAERIFDASFPWRIKAASAHLPFAVGFYCLYAALIVGGRLYQMLAARHPAPALMTFLVINGAVGAAIFAAGRGMVGGGLVALSAAVFLYIHVPRFGVPTVFRSTLHRREVAKVGKELERQQKKMEALMQDIERL